MAVKLICEPGKVVTKEEFLGFPPYSIALDGYCECEPFFDEERLLRNFDHHKGVDLSSTRSTCEQVLAAINIGLFRAFRTLKGNPKALVYINDFDQDVLLATYALRYPERIARPRLKSLFRIQDLMDMSGGFYPVNKRWANIRQLAWVTKPY